ncbi:MAG: Fur family transcriptional regulator [Ruminococcus sp.]|jgi:Fur family peroxide stress response transcriptional regulator
MAALKYSRQRESIKEFLMTRKDHPTADTIYENIRMIYPNVSLGTIYRNLSLLENIGDICRITVENGPDRFDSNTNHHHHFICRRCHSVTDLEMENIDYIKEVASQNFDGVIERYVTNFYGLCKDCAKNMKTA